jgi:hypothetical protein
MMNWKGFGRERLLLTEVLPLNLPGETKGNLIETSIRRVGITAETRTKHLLNETLVKRYDNWIGFSV